jgi:hypothetical protein
MPTEVDETGTRYAGDPIRSAMRDDPMPASVVSSHLSEELSRLDEAIGVLQDRLAYVLIPANDKNAGGLLQQGETGPCAPLTDVLAAHTSHASVMTLRIHELIARLDLPA